MHTVCHLLAALFLLPYALYAQSFLLEGQIVDAITGEPLSDANLNTGTTGLRSDDDGHFSLFLTTSDSLTVSFVGYKTRTLRPQNARNLTIRLRRAILATADGCDDWDRLAGDHLGADAPGDGDERVELVCLAGVRHGEHDVLRADAPEVSV